MTVSIGRAASNWLGLSICWVLTKATKRGAKKIPTAVIITTTPITLVSHSIFVMLATKIMNATTKSAKGNLPSYLRIYIAGGVIYAISPTKPVIAPAKA
jgi:hypothetical protein